MKGNKKILVVAVLLLLIAVSYSTYAIYKSSATGSAEVSTAAWVVKVNNEDIVANNTFTLGNVTWATPRYGKADTIAPGDHGTVDIVIDADGSQVDVGYEISIDLASIDNNQFSIEPATAGDLTGTISYSATEGQMEKTVTLNIVWNGVDTASANAEDIDLSANELEIPIVVTATQNPNPAA